MKSAVPQARKLFANNSPEEMEEMKPHFSSLAREFMILAGFYKTDCIAIPRAPVPSATMMLPQCMRTPLPYSTALQGGPGAAWRRRRARCVLLRP